LFEKALVMYIYAETPIHPGSGATISGAVDLPIQRERHTEFPMIQGSSLKGVLRNAPKGAKKSSSIALSDKCENCPEKKDDKLEEACPLCKQIFGSEEGVGGVSITDAKILAFPVRTLKGVFGWITCPLALERYKRDLNIAGITVKWGIPKLSGDGKAKVRKNSNLIADGHVYIEDLKLECEKDEDINAIAEDIANALPDSNVYSEVKEKIKKDLVIVSDDVFRDLVSLTTEVATRIRINPKTGTVETGALWSEEYLPTDTIMYSLILIPSRPSSLSSDEIAKKLNQYNGKVLQLGGDETTGKGFAIVKLVGGDKDVKKS